MGGGDSGEIEVAALQQEIEVEFDSEPGVVLMQVEPTLPTLQLLGRRSHEGEDREEEEEHSGKAQRVE